jgi:hypothetical protein
MNPVFQAAGEVCRFLEGRGWRFCVIGGLAVIRWGEPRATADADICLLTGFGHEAEYVDSILDWLPGRIDGARQFALEHRVLLASAPNGLPVDISLGGIPFEEQMIQRATPWTFDRQTTMVTCSAEDLIVLKAFAGRHQDWAAIEGILARQRGRLDWPYINANLAPLCEAAERPEAVATLRQLQRRQST